MCIICTEYDKDQDLMAIKAKIKMARHEKFIDAEHLDEIETGLRE